MRKDGKKEQEKQLSKSEILLKQKTQREVSHNEDAENEHGFSTSLNEELDELLKKDKKRFFGGCGG